MMRKTHGVRTAALLGGVALVLNGCYTYADVRVPLVPPGADVRARVTDAEAARVQPLLGYRATRLDGVVVQRDDRGLLMRVPARVFDDAGDARRLERQLQLAQQDVVTLQLRRLSVPRTAALVVAGIAAMAFIATRSLNGTGGGALPPQSGNPRNLVVPIR